MSHKFCFHATVNSHDMSNIKIPPVLSDKYEYDSTISWNSHITDITINVMRTKLYFRIGSDDRMYSLLYDSQIWSIEN